MPIAPPPIAMVQRHAEPAAVVPAVVVPPPPVIVVPEPYPAPIVVLDPPPEPPPPPPPPGDPRTIPPTVRAMLDAAMETGDESQVNTIVRFSTAADPRATDAVIKLATQWRERRARERDERLRQATAFELWTGKIEAGGFLSTGNSRIAGITGIADLQREGLRWRHKLHGQADLQRTNGVVSRERYVASYEPNLKLSAGRYIYGSGQFEADRFLGYDERFSVSTGVGFNALRTRALKLALELGPAYRYTNFTDGVNESAVAARGNLDFDWTVRQGLVFSTDASAYLQRNNSTVSSTTALAAKLLGPLSARLSYTLQYESDPPLDRVTTDATSRASLVYSF